MDACNMQINLKIFHSFNNKPFTKNFNKQQILDETSTYLRKAYVCFTHNYNEVSTHHFETQGMHVRCRFSENLTDLFCALTGVFIPKFHQILR